VNPADRDYETRVIEILMTVSVNVDVLGERAQRRGVPLAVMLTEIASGLEVRAADRIRSAEHVIAVGSRVRVGAST
jgi:hypothetical protein